MSQLSLKRLHFNLMLFSLIAFNIYTSSQKVTIISLDEKVYPLESYNPLFQRFIESDSLAFLAIRKRLLAGDYSDSITKFRLVVCLPKAESLGTDRMYSFYICPYKCDTVYAGYPSIASTDVPYTTITVGDGRKKYKVTLLTMSKTVQVTDISDKNISPDIRLFENKLPPKKFQLVNGDTLSLSHFEHQHKLIYLFFGSPTDNSATKMLDTLGEVYAKYKNNVNIVSLLPLGYSGMYADTDQIKKNSIDKKVSWIQGYLSLEIAAELFVNGGNYGMLFNEYGDVLKMCMFPATLKTYLKEKYDH